MRILGEFEHVRQYRVVQTGASSLRVELDPLTPEVAADVSAELRGLLRAQGVDDVTIDVVSYEPDPTRKLRRVERLNP